MENKGWVKLWRNQFSSWISKKPFCDGYAWCYLYQKANHKAGMVNFRNEYIKVERGQLLTSKLQLQEIFGWTYRHVENFLKALENDEMIRNRTTNRYIVITILNYDKYQSKEDKSDEQNEEQIMNRLGTDYEQIKNEATQTRINKNVKNVKNVKNNMYITPSNVETLPEVDTNKNSFPDEPIEEQKPKKAEKISFDFVGEKWTGLKKEHFTNWLEAYPLIDIDRELVKAKEWVLGNLNKSTRKSNWRQFLNNWFSKAQTFEERKVIYAGSYRK